MIIEYLNLIGDIKNTRIKVEVDVIKETTEKVVFTADGMFGEYELNKTNGEIRSDYNLLIGKNADIIN